MSSPRPVFSSVRTARTVVHLPACPNGCGEMLATGDGWQCPICNRFFGYRRGEMHP